MAGGEVGVNRNRNAAWPSVSGCRCRSGRRGCCLLPPAPEVAAGSPPENNRAIPAIIATAAMAIQTFFIAKLTCNLLLPPQPASLQLRPLCQAEVLAGTFGPSYAGGRMLTRNIDKAREAYRKQDIDSLRSSHDAGHEPHSGDSGKYIKSIVYGGLDGIITTFAVVAGVAGAALPVGRRPDFGVCQPDRRRTCNGVW